MPWWSVNNGSPQRFKRRFIGVSHFLVIRRAHLVQKLSHLDVIGAHTRAAY